MNWILTFLLIGVGIGLIVYWILMEIFLFRVRKGESRNEEREATRFEPKTAVLLALRGADPALEICVNCVLTQDYGPYSVFFLVDNETDPAATVVREILNSTGSEKGRLVVFENHLSTCSLKCGALSQMWEKLKDSDFEVFVNVDSDTNPPRDWLRRLVAPLQNPEIAVASGARWYVPAKCQLGSVIRHLWNMAAVIQMFFFRIPWGGSLAIRREVFEKGKLAEIWSRSFTDDTVTSVPARKLGKKCQVIPSLLLVNREECSMRSVYPWLKRQILCVRKYHPSWIFMIFQGIFLATPIAAILGGLAVGAFQANWALVVPALLFLGVWFLGICVAFFIMEERVHGALRRQGESIPKRKLSFMLGACFLIPLAQLLYLTAIIGSYRLKTVKWRGIQYVLGPKNSIQMAGYVPYAEVEAEDLPVSENESL